MSADIGAIDLMTFGARLRATGAVAGVIVRRLGTGGRTFAVPFLKVLSIPMHRGVATASVLGIWIAVPAVASFVWSGLSVPELRTPRRAFA